MLPVSAPASAARSDTPSDCSGDCPICLESLSGSRTVVITACQHLLHYRCNDRWLKGKPRHKRSCALCRQKLLPLRLVHDDNRPRRLVQPGIVDICQNGEYDKLRQLLSETPALARLRYWSDRSDSMTPLIIIAALEGGNERIVAELIARGADVNATNDYQISCLSLSAVHDQTEVAKTLIANGADVNTRDTEGRTPLHWACMNNDTELAKALLTQGADCYATCNTGYTPLDLALSSTYREIYDILRSALDSIGQD